MSTGGLHFPSHTFSHSSSTSLLVCDWERAKETGGKRREEFALFLPQFRALYSRSTFSHLLVCLLRFSGYPECSALKKVFYQAPRICGGLSITACIIAEWWKKSKSMWSRIILKWQIILKGVLFPRGKVRKTYDSKNVLSFDLLSLLHLLCFLNVICAWCFCHTANSWEKGFWLSFFNYVHVQSLI